MYLLLLPPLLITVVTLGIEVMCGACPVDLMQGGLPRGTRANQNVFANIVQLCNVNAS